MKAAIDDGWQNFVAVEENTIIGETSGSASAFLVHLLHKQEKRPILIVTTERIESRFASDLRFFSEHVIDYPAWDSLPSDEMPPSKDISGRRLFALETLKKTQAPLVLTTPAALCQKTVHPDNLELLKITVKKGDKINFEHFGKQLLEAGFIKVPVVQDKGQFTTRRGIIDLFETSAKAPVRIEFWDEEVESIRRFDPMSQKSTEKITETEILPADEYTWARAESASLLDHLHEKPLVIFDDITALEDAVVFLKKYESAKNDLFEPFAKVLKNLKSQKQLLICREKLEELFPDYHPKKECFDLFGAAVKAKVALPYFRGAARALFSSDELSLNNIQKVLHDTAETRESLMHISFVSDNDQEEKSLREHLGTVLDHPKIEGHFTRGYLSEGFFAREANRGIISFTELSGHYKVRTPSQRTRVHHTAAEVFSPAPGDLVVHYHAGIGRYIGIEKKIDHTGHASEFLALEYAGSAKLFVPMTQAYLLSPYIGGSEKRPTLNTLGSNKWQKAKVQTQKAVVGYAKKLIEVQAARESGKLHAYREDSELMHAFEKSFPYTETDDQLLAIQDVKRAMLEKKCMDLLVCGDVGFGKTEVAMRAAFKAVCDGDVQVGVLVPTTVLAMQHFDTFSERMSGFPIRIAVVSRAKKASQIKQTLADLKAGKIDILIGTHRLLSQDVEFARLGLMIIDEEQRFGVRAKEKLKMQKERIDALALSATPIPRTLYMAVSGAKAMSVIATPPSDRLPIQMVICEQNNEVLERAIQRELGRGGQVFYIHNRVETIGGRAKDLEKLIPTARVVIAHGQLPQEELDRVFHLFKKGDADILVATTLIENGVDIPNANTILIERADTHGLSDLYQIKGRVGRSSRVGYAYFLTPANRQLREESQKRLQALVEAGNYGGGMRIAMRDLEIRGAGDILGTEQSGHASSVGFHLYCRLLKKAVSALKGKKSCDWIETKIEFPHKAHIPLDYIESEELRLEFYCRLAEVENPAEVDTIFHELEDRFGAAPEPTVWLWQMMRIKAFGTADGWAWIKLEKNRLIAHKQLAKEIKAFAFALKEQDDPRKLADEIIETLSKK